MPEYVVPILGMEENGRTWDMRSTLRSAIGTASTLHRNSTTGHLDGPFDDKLALRIVDEIMSNIDAYVSEQIKQHTLNQEAKRALILRREDWHDSPDAMVWAEKFCEQQRNYNKDEDDLKEGETRSIDPTDEGFMVSWFANAMCAASRPYENANAMQEVKEEIRSSPLDVMSPPRIQEKLPDIECINGTHFAGGLNLVPHTGQTVNHQGCIFRGRDANGRLYMEKDGIRQYAIRDNPQA